MSREVARRLARRMTNSVHTHRERPLHEARHSSSRHIQSHSSSPPSLLIRVIGAHRHVTAIRATGSASSASSKVGPESVTGDIGASGTSHFFSDASAVRGLEESRGGIETVFP